MSRSSVNTRTKVLAGGVTAIAVVGGLFAAGSAEHFAAARWLRRPIKSSRHHTMYAVPALRDVMEGPGFSCRM
ncbi:hypothetical protein [Arthrobacter sp. R4-81]